MVRGVVGITWWTPSRKNGFGYAEHETDPIDFGGLWRTEFCELGGAPGGVGAPSMPYKVPSRFSQNYRYIFTFRDVCTVVFFGNVPPEWVGYAGMSQYLPVIPLGPLRCLRVLHNIMNKQKTFTSTVNNVGAVAFLHVTQPQTDFVSMLQSFTAALSPFHIALSIEEVQCGRCHHCIYSSMSDDTPPSFTSKI